MDLAMAGDGAKTVIGRATIGKRGRVCRLEGRFRQFGTPSDFASWAGGNCPHRPSDSPSPGLPNFLVSPGCERCPACGSSDLEKSHDRKRATR